MKCFAELKKYLLLQSQSKKLGILSKKLVFYGFLVEIIRESSFPKESKSLILLSFEDPRKIYKSKICYFSGQLVERPDAIGKVAGIEQG